jgi:hypothetical protein
VAFPILIVKKISESLGETIRAIEVSKHVHPQIDALLQGQDLYHLCLGRICPDAEGPAPDHNLFARRLSIKERKDECANGLGQRCAKLRAVEDEKRAALARIPVPTSHALIADATGLPEWLVEIVPAMSFSTGLLVLGFVLVGFGAHASKEETAVPLAVPAAMPDKNERVVSWVFNVYAVMDASGDPTEMVSRTTLARFTQSGIVPTTTNAVICELHRTWARPEAAEIADIYTMATPNYRAVMESFQKAKEVGSATK